MVEKLKTYIINLPESKSRRIHMENQLSFYPELELEFWPATNGKTLPDIEKKKIYNEQGAIKKLGRPLSSGEIGIAHSQLLIYKDIITKNIATSLILEDDVLISPYLSDCIESLRSNMEVSRPQIILLTPIYSYLNRSKKNLMKSQERYIVEPYGDYCWAAGYLINYAAAQILTEKLFPIYTVADDWKFISKAFRIKIYGLNNYLISFAKVGGQWNSIIGSEKKRINMAKSKNEPKYVFVLKTTYFTIYRMGKGITDFIKGVKKNNQLMFDYNGIKLPKF